MLVFPYDIFNLYVMFDNQLIEYFIRNNQNKNFKRITANIEILRILNN